MKPETVKTLREINRRFYADCAKDFSATRRRAWPGWQRVLEAVVRPGQGDSDPDWSVLDVGCGNGRFADSLAAWAGARPMLYTGIDFSAALLEEARQRVTLNAEFHRLDLPDGLGAWRPRYHLVAAFGIFHHIPGRELRQQFASELIARVLGGGHLVLSLWRFLDKERFRDRCVSLAEPLPRSLALDRDDLESGDALLRWGSRPGDLRYCHHFDDEEIAGLSGLPGVSVVDQFRADGEDGDSNHYLVLRALS